MTKENGKHHDLIRVEQPHLSGCLWQKTNVMEILSSVPKLDEHSVTSWHAIVELGATSARKKRES